MESRLRDTLLTNKVFARELRSRQELSDRELRERYEREKERYRLPERAEVREIIVVVPEGADQQTIATLEAKAAAVAARATAGEDFAKLATEFSDSPTKDQGGSLGTIARGELLPVLENAVFNSGATGVGGPVRTPAGFHVLKVEKRLPSEVPGFDTVKDKLRQEVSDETFQRDYTAYIERLRKEAFVQINEAMIPPS